VKTEAVPKATPTKGFFFVPSASPFLAQANESNGSRCWQGTSASLLSLLRGLFPAQADAARYKGCQKRDDVEQEKARGDQYLDLSKRASAAFFVNLALRVKGEAGRSASSSSSTANLALLSLR
jgi:hypothetical protein